MLAAWEAGINFFFLTADMHWPMYEPLRRGLKTLFKKPGARDSVVICTTAYVTQPDFCEMPFEEVVEALPGLDRIDVVTMGGVSEGDFKQRLPVYQRHRESGFVGNKAIGASFHDRKTARAAINQHLVDLAFIRFNAGHPGAEADVFPHLEQPRHTRLFNFKTIDGWVAPPQLDALGLDPRSWQPHPVDHYRFALSQPSLDGVLAALSHPREVQQLADALAAGPMAQEDQRYLITLAKARRSVEEAPSPRGGAGRGEG
ncbi:MAG: hypothetical protein Q8L48_18105 [Archangium sp.]|nr:hypothetical protein [Archangium sp.]